MPLEQCHQIDCIDPKAFRLNNNTSAEHVTKSIIARPHHITAHIMSLVSFESAEGRLKFRSPEVSDAQNLLDRVRDPKCVLHVPFLREGKFTLEGNQRRIERWRKETGTKSCFFVVVRKSDDLVIGDGGFETIDLEAHTGDAGIMLDSGEGVRGQGYAVETMQSTFKYGFEHLGLDRIFVRTLKENAPMVGVMEKHFGLKAEEAETEMGLECCFVVQRDRFEKAL